MEDMYTQVELSSPLGQREVWWLPVPAGRAKIGEKITRGRGNASMDWTITAVCTTLPKLALPPNARVADSFKREAQTIAFMSI